MDVNENTLILIKRVALQPIASELAPTKKPLRLLIEAIFGAIRISGLRWRWGVFFACITTL